MQTKEEKALYDKEYRLKNKEKCKINGKNYRERNKKSLIEKSKEYDLKNKEKIAKRKQKYYLDNKDKILKICKQYRENNPVEKTGKKGTGNYNIALAERLKEVWLCETLYFYKFKMIEDDGTIFYKYGLSKNIKNRLYHIPYNVEILEKSLMTKYDAVWMEYNSLKSVNRYTPQKMFGGYTECFN